MKSIGNSLLVALLMVGSWLVACGSGCDIERQARSDAQRETTTDNTEDSTADDTHDIRDSGIRDSVEVDAVDVEAQPALWWKSFEQHCSEGGVTPPSERWRPPREPLVAGELPRVLWESRDLCAGVLAGAERDAEGSESFAYMEVADTNGVSEQLVTFLEQHVSTAPHSVFGGVAVVDANTGLPIACYETPVERPAHMPQSKILATVSDWGDHFLAISQGNIDGTTSLVVQRGGHTGSFLTQVSGDGATTPSELVMHNGEVVVQAGWGTAGFAIDDGAPLWGVGSVGHTMFGRLSTPADGRLLGVDSSGTLFEERSCGQLAPLPWTGVWGRPLVVGDQLVLLEANSNDLVVYNGTVEQFREPNCKFPVQVSAELVACVHTVQGETHALVVRSLDGAVRRSVLLPDIGQLTRYFGPVAGHGGKVLLLGTYYGSEIGESHQLFSIDAIEGKVDWAFEFSPEGPGWAGFDHAVLTPRGVWIAPTQKSMIAIQTGVFGLAPTSYPRGWQGGNENRGHVLVE